MSSPSTYFLYLSRFRGFLGDGGVFSLSAKEDGLDGVFLVLAAGVLLPLLGREVDLPPLEADCPPVDLGLPGGSRLLERPTRFFFLSGESVGLILRRMLGGIFVSISSPCVLRAGVVASLPRLVPVVGLGILIVDTERRALGN
jgi:hypothetical protein